MSDDSHLIFDIISALVTVGWLVVGLLIRNSLSEIKLTQAADKADMVRHQNDIKDDLNKKHAENTQSVAVHIAEDTQKFDAISRTLTRIDGKLDRMANNGTH